MIYLAILGKIYNEKSYFKTDVLRIMSQEIFKYEIKFDAYLRECAKSTDYQRIAEENLSKLVQEDNNQNVLANVLSFNYTHIPSKVTSEEGDEISIKVKDNVHGKLGNEIIFGIDHGTIDNDTPLYNFTKTYRKLYENKDSEESVLSIDIKVIKIYGHSLSNADYAYFQSIFDFLNIYENPINIIVYYTKYKENEAEIRQELSNAVQKLISRYGQSMDNKEKGKNLLHKLLLENRLTIKKINLKEASKRRRFA
ncbi:AbiH family protein, partial [Listeria monocytogenes]